MRALATALEAQLDDSAGADVRAAVTRALAGLLVDGTSAAQAESGTYARSVLEVTVSPACLA